MADLVRHVHIHQNVSHFMGAFILDPAGQLKVLVNSSRRDRAVFTLKQETREKVV